MAWQHGNVMAITLKIMLTTLQLKYYLCIYHKNYCKCFYKMISFTFLLVNPPNIFFHLKKAFQQENDGWVKMINNMAQMLLI